MAKHGPLRPEETRGISEVRPDGEMGGWGWGWLSEKHLLMFEFGAQRWDSVRLEEEAFMTGNCDVDLLSGSAIHQKQSLMIQRIGFQCFPVGVQKGELCTLSSSAQNG